MNKSMYRIRNRGDYVNSRNKNKERKMNLIYKTVIPEMCKLVWYKPFSLIELQVDSWKISLKVVHVVTYLSKNDLLFPASS